MNPLFGWPPKWSEAWPVIIEIVLLYIVLYAILRFLRGTGGAGVLRGLVFFTIMTLVIVIFFVDKLKLYRIEQLMTEKVLLFLLLIAVLFQPEVRRLLLRLGDVPMFRWLFRVPSSVVPEIADALFTLSQRRIGALIVLEREVPLGAVLEGGTALNSLVSSELLVTIFWPGSPLHDGAVIVQGDRIAAAGCLLPLTEQPGLAKTLGTRHRAAIGITEESDALSIVVSEETQQVSVAHRGRLTMGLSKDQLRKILEETLTESAPAAANAHP